MKLDCVCVFALLVGSAAGLAYDSAMPYGGACSLTYGDVMKKRDWVCDDSQFEAYPRTQIDRYMVAQRNSLIYNQTKMFLKNAAGCGQFHDADAIYGTDDYYTYESVCKMVRKPVRVLWYKVPNYVVPANLMGLNKGLLPVHVLEGQDLFDVECFHPWSTGIPAHIPENRAKYLRRISWDDVKSRLCLSGYNYNYNLVCRPTGFVERTVYVYSQHADRIFPVVVPDVPTYCTCSYCRCNTVG